jgi:hypothetical protein
MFFAVAAGSQEMLFDAMLQQNNLQWMSLCQCKARD